MSLEPGTKIAHYEVVELIGQGGMGEVYRARDDELDRDVAIKVLPTELASDEEHLWRLEREAKVLASVNHANIAAVHGLESTGESHAIVMELVHGPTLADCIHEGPMELEEALPIAKQITEALAAAHAQSVIHRDLKPANIKISPDGHVKVLDFGLAKQLPQETAEPDDESPTRAQETAAGVVLGTTAYMSPEQAKGKTVDKRTDIWAFGCILYEMLTGEPAFQGDDASDVVAAILRTEPDFDQLPPDAPSTIERVLRRCLNKDPRIRLADISDAGLEIAEAGRSENEPSTRTRVNLAKPLWLAVTLGLVALTWFVAQGPSSRMTPTTAGVARFTVALPDGDLLNMTTGGLAVSADGERLAYVATRDRTKSLYVRERASLDAEAITGSEGAQYPFFSPDGSWLAFFNGSALMKVSLSGGAPQQVCEAKYPVGAAWGPDDRIVFATRRQGLRSVSASGGASTQIATGSTAFPSFLPDGNSILYVDEPYTDPKVTVRRLDSGDERTLIEGTDPRLFADFLLFVRDTSLWAVRWDGRGDVDGEVVPVLDDVNVLSMFGGASYDIAADGSLTYVAGAPGGSLVVVEPNGSQTSVGNLEDYHSIRLSPDGRKVLGDGRQGLWVHDLYTRARHTVALGYFPVWSPDGTTIAYGKLGDNASEVDLYVKNADGTGEAESLLSEPTSQSPSSWSPDGQWIAVNHGGMGSTDGVQDIWMSSPSGEAGAFRESGANEFGAVFSADGRWIAYQSDQSGRFEVYVEPFTGTGERNAVSVRGGSSPLFSPDGSELYYREDTAVMKVSVSTTDGFTVSAPTLVHDGPYWLDPTGHVAFGVFPDGKLLMIDTGQANEIRVVLHWLSELQRLVADGG